MDHYPSSRLLKKILVIYCLGNQCPGTSFAKFGKKVEEETRAVSLSSPMKWSLSLHCSAQQNWIPFFVKASFQESAELQK